MPGRLCTDKEPTVPFVAKIDVSKLPLETLHVGFTSSWGASRCEDLESTVSTHPQLLSEYWQQHQHMDWNLRQLHNVSNFEAGEIHKQFGGHQADYIACTQVTIYLAQYGHKKKTVCVVDVLLRPTATNMGDDRCWAQEIQWGIGEFNIRQIPIFVVKIMAAENTDFESAPLCYFQKGTDAKTKLTHAKNPARVYTNLPPPSTRLPQPRTSNGSGQQNAAQLGASLRYKTFERSQRFQLTWKCWRKLYSYVRYSGLSSGGTMSGWLTKRACEKSCTTSRECGTPLMQACTFVEGDESPRWVCMTTPNRLQHCWLWANTGKVVDLPPGQSCSTHESVAWSYWSRTTIILCLHGMPSKLVSLLKQQLCEPESRPRQLVFALDLSFHSVTIGFAIVCSQHWLLVNRSGFWWLAVEFWGLISYNQ